MPELPLIEVLRRATEYLRAHGSESPRLDAELLLAAALGLRRLDLYLRFERPLSDAELAPYRALVADRGRGRPVAYLLGRREFMGLDFEVTDQVLVPNPDTETLVLLATAWLGERGGPARVADVGTGSGCVAVAVAHFVPQAEVEAGDDSPAAVELAARNADRLGVGDRVRVHQGDLMAPLEGDFDLVLANLPYVDEAAELAPAVLAQPHHALFAADGGAALVNRLLEEAGPRLRPGGAVMLEVDEAMLDRVRLEGWAGSRRHRDLGGRTRVLEAWRS